ncbi:MAG: helix-turn-helix domain-containing protein [Lachnospiraceae bacterium]
MQYGRVIIKLDNLIKQSGLSKNKVMQKAEMQMTQLNNYCNNKVVLVDLNVIARLCTVLNCKIEDILEFLPYEK